MDNLDKKLLILLQENFPLMPRPFKRLAKRLSLCEEEVITRVKRLKACGIIKRIGSVYDSENLGFKRTLVGVSVSDGKLKKVVDLVNGFSEVTHNYLRKGSRFNLWFTLICPTYSRINSILKTIKRKTAVKEIINLPTVKTIKIKTIFKI